MTQPAPERYRIEQKLGAGGMGVVYRATDTHLERTVAVKMLDESLLDDVAGTLVVREARAASALNHPHICTVHEVTEVDGRSCIVMEHVEGTSLADLIPPRGLPPELAVRFGLQIADALAHAHDRAVIHRDLTSANVMITGDGRAKVLDFGLARHARESQCGIVTQVGDVWSSDDSLGGTLPYMSPDVLTGHPPQARDDLWSLGVLLYELAVGELPFRGATRFELATSIQRDPPAAMPARVSAGLRAVILRCLSRDDGTRYRRAQEVRAALEAVQAHAGAAAATHGASALFRLVALAALAIGGIVLVVTLLSFRRTALPATPESAAVTLAPIALAVLPFANANGDPQLDYLTDGLAESVISSLGRVPGKLKVVSLSAVQPYRGQTIDARAVGQALNVAAILQGSIVQRNDVVSVVVELVSTTDRSHIWGERYDKRHQDLLGIQQEIAMRISSALQLRLSGDERQALKRQYPLSAEAFQLYLKAQYHLARFTPADYRRSLGYFQQAIQRDETYASAHAGLALVLAAMTYDGLLPPSTYQEVERAASTARALDDTLAAPHEALALLTFAYRWKWDEAERQFQRALALSPDEEAVHRYYGVFLRTQCRWDAAIAAMQRAVAINPVSAETSKALGATYFWARRYDLAIEQYHKTLALDATHAQTHDLLADAYAAKGLYRQALESRRTYLRLEGAFDDAESLGTDGSEAGYRTAMRSIHRRYLAALQRAAPTQYVSPMEFALIYIALGDTDRAFARLDEAFGQRAPWLTTLAADPAFDPLRSDPRFAALVARVGIPYRSS